MTPEVVEALGGIVDRFGLPLAILAGLLWALFTRRLVIGSELEYVEARRREERDGRLAAEVVVRELTDAVEKLTEGLDRMADSIVDGLRYDQAARRTPRR